MNAAVTSLLMLLFVLPGFGLDSDQRQEPDQRGRPLLRHRQHEPKEERSVGDSVRVIIFASRRLRDVRISSTSGLLLDGAKHAKAITIVCDGDRLRIEKRRFSGVTVASSSARGGVNLLLVGDGASRRVRGGIRIDVVGGYLRMIASVRQRDYLASTLAAETVANDPMEYLVAMARLQRNYLIEHRGRHAPEADICDNTHCQRSDMTDVRGRTYMAVDRAGRITLEAEGHYPCYYSVNCGGSTLTPSQIWNHAEAGYSNVICTHCKSSERFRWGRSIPSSPEADRILRRAPRPPFIDDDFKIQLGRVVGFNRVLSNTIDRIERRGQQGWRLYGRGFGHRVGLCQEGGVALARNRWRAGAILHYYFPSATLRSRE